MKLVGIVTSLLVLTATVVLPESSRADLDINISIGQPVAVAPPALPVYVVPAPPVQGVLWMPGYWQWSPFGYYWIPGTWVEPPAAGLLWTPGYWGWNNNNFAWHEGYWGEHVGYYGGINYGGGYGSSGFNGGHWRNGTYIVNRSVTNVTNITNVTSNYSNVSFNGGPGGTKAEPTAQQQAVAHEKHIAPTQAQVNHGHAASSNTQLRASANHGKPTIAATAKPGIFSGTGVVAAKQAGPVNNAAEKHNQSVLKNPSLAKGAALPKAAHEEEQNKREPEEKIHAVPQEKIAEPNREERPKAQVETAHEPQGKPKAQPEEKPKAEAPHPQEPKPAEKEHVPEEKEEHPEHGEHE